MGFIIGVVRGVGRGMLLNDDFFECLGTFKSFVIKEAMLLNHYAL